MTVTPSRWSWIVQEEHDGDEFSWPRLFIVLGLILTSLATLADEGFAQDLVATWRNGLDFRSSDGQVQAKIGGRLFNDWSFVSEDDEIKSTLGSQEDGTEFRAARLYLSGVFNEVIEFKIQNDFAKGAVEFKDVFMGLKRTPGLGAGLRVGHFKQPFGLEELTSSKDIMFMERSTAADMAPSRKTGIMLHDLVFSDRMLWAASMFRETTVLGRVRSDSGYSFAARLSGLPYVGGADEWTDMVHVGGAVARREPSLAAIPLVLGPEIRFHNPYMILLLDADHWWQFGGELAFAKGSFLVQGEWTQYLVPDATIFESSLQRRDGSFYSYYVQAAWLATGEHRRYKKSAGHFDRVVPRKSFGPGAGGAIEFAARFSQTDFQDGELDGGKLDSFSIGANWYLAPISRVMFNWVYSDGTSPEGQGASSAVTVRFQVGL
jgi:phosphate-selective porin OprO/OprP